MRSEIVSDVVVYDVSVSQRAISASEEPSYACALPSAKAFRAKLKERFLNALQRYALSATPPNRKAHGVQKSVHDKNKFSLSP